MALPHPRILAPGLRVISVGEWMPHQNSRKVCHTVTGWYGISGAGMYTKDGQGNLRLVALFQGGIFRDPDSDKNEAVIIPSDVLRHVNKAGVA
ncbi:hypothetical protein EV356DRAFT_499246 [Viridothelium virens]|uniref:Uncharacterized protein n=1 Tax=Viridothelium virens TaxID=1048519 RepID=A0A6A6HCZ3_VIRVR|nr:hypothetical protein EV356DRAFT_499246 [Viridothelium virens]